MPGSDYEFEEVGGRRGKRINLYRKYLADNKEGALEALGPVSMSSRGPVRTQLLQGDEPD